MTKIRNSTYFFIGKISESNCKYQVQNMSITKDYVFELYLDGISVWGSTKKPFIDVRAEITKILDTIISSVVFKTSKPISYSLQNWVEVKEQIALKNIIGWFMTRGHIVDVKPTRSPINTSWKQAVKYYQILSKSNSNYSIALQDYYKAIIDTSDDALFFAYRAIEDICRAVSELDNTEDKAWDKMHIILKTKESDIEPLKKVADEIRHGKKNTKIIQSARKRKNKLIQISHSIIEKAFKIKFPTF